MTTTSSEEQSDATVAAVAAASTTSPILTQPQRMFLGVIVLFSVDVIWVASSELTEFIFHEEKFDKPFFSTYVKTSMFLIFLIGSLVWRPWFSKRSNSYMPLNNNRRCSESINVGDEEIIDDATTLGPSAYVPVNYDPNSGNESDDSNHIHNRSVRFNKLAEVRHMSEKDAAEAIFARMSYQASVQAEEVAYRLASRLSPGDTARLAITFCILWFFANYTYQLALSRSQAGMVNVLSSSSSLFTLFLAAIFPSVDTDALTLSKLIAVLGSIVGVVLVSFSDKITSGTLWGAIFALLSAFFYAAYLVFLRRKVNHEDKLDIPLFFGFVGFFNLLLLWPLFFILNYADVEVFEWPSKRQWLFLIINGVIGTVFSEILWIWGCFLTSSLIATLAISLTIPMSMVADVMFQNISYSFLFYIGTVPMIISFFSVTLLSHYGNRDPIMDFFRGVASHHHGDHYYSRVATLEPNDTDTDGLLNDNEDEIIDEDEDNVHQTQTTA